MSEERIIIEKQLEELTEAVLEVGEAISGGGPALQFDGTKKRYEKIMREWFRARGVNAMSAAGITQLCEKWYEASKDGWHGTVTFANPKAQDASQVSTGTRGGDNTGMTCTPSTNATAGQDDFAGLPLFACKNVNFIVDPTSLDIIITAIEGITDNFIKDDPDIYVGVMQMTGWAYEKDDAETYTIGYADRKVEVSGCNPLPEAVRVDGTVRSFVVHSKYMSCTVNNKMTSCAGLVPTAFNSHNSLHSSAQSPYSGGTTADLAFLMLMTYIKYASLTLDGILQGCCSYNLQYYAQVSETGVKRIILPSDAGILAGSSVLIGTYSGSTDRGQQSVRSISGGARVTSVENVTISGTTYKAVYVDVPEAFNTAANGAAATGSTIVTTWHWATGSCDNVQGNDGSPGSNTSGAYPCKLQGIEFMSGGYEVLADVILDETTVDGASVYVPCIVRRRSQQATNVTANYERLTELKIEKEASAGWKYIKKEKYTKGVFFPNMIGGSSSTFTRDGFYMDAAATTGLREWLAFGSLDAGPALAGLSFLRGGSGLSHAVWACLGRLSPNGNRGELTA